MKSDSENTVIENDREAYLRVLDAALSRTRAKLEHAECRIDIALRSGRISGSDQLLNAQRRARYGLGCFESCLQQLTSSSSLDWHQRRSEVDLALEEFSDSVRNVVARFP